jgi:hypothetical protein
MEFTNASLFSFYDWCNGNQRKCCRGRFPCPVNTVPIKIVTPGYSSGIKLSAAELSDSLPHFRTLVETVTERINSWMTSNNFCIDGAKDMESMLSAEREKHSLLQFVYWHLDVDEYTVPALLPSTGDTSSCRISSPWIDLVVERKPVPRIVGIVRWNERQLLTDQVVLAGARNVPPGVAIPLTGNEFAYFLSTYTRSEILEKSVAKPIEERVPPDILWLLRRSRQSTRGPFVHYVLSAMDNATEKGAESYTKLVLALIDRCFASDGANLHYNSILDVADPVLLEQYKIDTLIR